MNERYQIVQSDNQLPAAQPMLVASLPLPPPGSEAGASIDIAGIIDAFRRRWWLVALFALAGGALATLYVLWSKPIYASHATVEVAQGHLNILDIKELRPEDLSNLEVLKTIEQSFSSGSLMLRVADACELRGDPDFQPRGGGQYTDAQFAQLLGGMIDVSLRRGTRLIDIVAKDTDPERARRIAEAVVIEYGRREIEDGQSLATDAQGSLAEEAERLRKRLEAAEAKLLAYREQHRTVALEGKEAVLDEKAKAVNAELAKTKAERLRLEADLAQLGGEGATSAQAALVMPSVATRPEIVALRGKLSEKEAEFAMLKKRYQYKHPTYIKVSSELEELRAGLERGALQATAGLRSTREALLQKEAKLEAELRDGREELLELTRVLVPYKAMVRDVEGDRLLFEGVRNRQKEAAASEAVKRGSLTMKDAPLAAWKPVWPKKKLVLGLGLAAGLALGCGLVLAGELFDRTFLSEAQAERVLAMPLLATLPAGGGGFEPGGEAGEAFRALRTSLSFVGRGAHARVFLFTSVADGEGAAACAANTAAAFARQGHRTLLIDGNLRVPEIDVLVAGNRLPLGLAQFLRGDGEPGQVVNSTPIDNFYILAAGEAVPNAVELLSNPRMAQLLDESGQWFQKIVISAPAIGGVSDGLLLARQAHSVCLVIRAGKTPRRDVLRACSLLSMAGAPPVGFVLNGVGGRSKPERSGATVRGGNGAVLQGA